jgi:hypothetical protein
MPLLWTASGLEVLVVAAGLGPGAAQALIAGGVKLG